MTYYRTKQKTGSEDMIVRLDGEKLELMSALYHNDWESSQYFHPDLKNDFIQISETAALEIISSWH